MVVKLTMVWNVSASVNWQVDMQDRGSLVFSSHRSIAFVVTSVLVNVASAVGLILLVKQIMTGYKFAYGASLTFLHCLFSAICIHLFQLLFYSPSPEDPRRKWNTETATTSNGSSVNLTCNNGSSETALDDCPISNTNISKTSSISSNSNLSSISSSNTSDAHSTSDSNLVTTTNKSNNNNSLTINPILNSNSNLSIFDAYSIALAQTGSIVLMNLSLATNSVGFYQLSKLLMIPCMLFVQVIFYGMQWLSTKVMLALLLLLGGVAVATVTDITVQLQGALLSLTAVLVTTMHQVRLSEVQQRRRMSPFGMLLQTSVPMAVTTGLIALLVDAVNYSSILSGGNLFDTNWMEDMRETLWSWGPKVLVVIASCATAVIVQFTTFAVISATSPITYQVVGHVKTCLVIVLGMLMFPIRQSNTQLLKNVVGICVAMLGTIAYSHFKHSDNLKKQKNDEEQQA